MTRDELAIGLIASDVLRIEDLDRLAVSSVDRLVHTIEVFRLKGPQTFLLPMSPSTAH